MAMKLPEGYDEQLKMSCPFCSLEVSAGHIEDGQLSTGFHANPACTGWTTADDIRQYMLLAMLKSRADAGIRERN